MLGCLSLKDFVGNAIMPCGCVLVSHVHYRSGRLCIFELEPYDINLMFLKSFFDLTVCQGMRDALYLVSWVNFIMVDRIVEISVLESGFSMDLGNFYPS